MATIKTTFETVIDRYWHAVSSLAAQKRASSSKNKNMPLEECRWEFQYCSAFGFRGQKKEPKKRDNLKELVAFRLDAIKFGGVILVCRAGRGHWSERLTQIPNRSDLKPIKAYPIPKEIVDSVREMCQKEIKEYKRFDSLSSVQMDAEIQETIKKVLEGGARVYTFPK